MNKPRPSKLSRASAYFRVAAKAERAGKSRDAARYRQIAERLVTESRRGRGE